MRAALLATVLASACVGHAPAPRAQAALARTSYAASGGLAAATLVATRVAFHWQHRAEAILAAAEPTSDSDYQAALRQRGDARAFALTTAIAALVVGGLGAVFHLREGSACGLVEIEGGLSARLVDVNGPILGAHVFPKPAVAAGGSIGGYVSSGVALALRLRLSTFLRSPERAEPAVGFLGPIVKVWATRRLWFSGGVGLGFKCPTCTPCDFCVVADPQAAALGFSARAGYRVGGQYAVELEVSTQKPSGDPNQPPGAERVTLYTLALDYVFGEPSAQPSL